MADIKQLESALIKADAAGNADDARALAAEIRRMRAMPAEQAQPQQSFVDQAKGVVGDAAKRALSFSGNNLAGGLRGAGSIGATLLEATPIGAAQRYMSGQSPLESMRQRRQDMDSGLEAMGADTSSAPFQVGKIGAEIAGTLGVGGAIAQPVSRFAPRLASAIQSGGMTVGPRQSLIRDMATRILGGGITGGASAGLVNPEQAGTGAAIGAALPPIVSGVGAVGRYAGDVARSVVRPFTEAGQQRIAGDIVRKFSEGGPASVNSAQMVQGSTPTLAEATGNAGLATLQRAVRDVRPNAFAEREAMNAAARSSAFDQIAGDSAQLGAARAARSNITDGLYAQALDSKAQQAATPFIKGQVTQLLKRPSINQASKEAQRLAMERGEKPAAQGSLRALHDVKTILDDKISEAVRAGKGGEAKSLQGTKDMLLNVMENLSPDYALARNAYAGLSKDVNAMEALQGLKLTDAQGNITLAKVKNAIDGLERQIASPGISNAKSISAEQLNVLRAINDDLLRQAALGKGRSIGSNTFQNIATDQIIGSMLPGRLGGLAQSKVGGAVGQLGRLAYSGPNEAIRNRLADLMLDPQAAQKVLQQPAIQANSPNAIAEILQQSAYRSAPVLSAQ